MLIVALLAVFCDSRYTAGTNCTAVKNTIGAHQTCGHRYRVSVEAKSRISLTSSDGDRYEENLKLEIRVNRTRHTTRQKKEKRVGPPRKHYL